MFWKHEAAGSSPVFPTNINDEISVKVNTAVCESVNKSSSLLFHPKGMR